MPERRTPELVIDGKPIPDLVEGFQVGHANAHALAPISGPFRLHLLL